jgi:hypothetical protein
MGAPVFRSSLRTAIVAAATAAFLLVPAAASADPAPTTDYELPFCGVAPDDDGRYCIVSLKRNGVEQPQHPGRLAGNPPPRVDGQRYSIGITAGVQPRLGGAYFSINRHDWDQQNGFGAAKFELAAVLGDTYRIELNTGDIRVRGMYGRMSDYSLTTTSGANGNVVVIEGRPVDVALHSACFAASCADDLVAESVLPSFNAYLTDWSSQFPVATWGAKAAVMRDSWAGFEVASNVLNSPTPAYERATNSIVLAMSAPHFASTGVLNRGVVDMFLPYAMLERSLEVPNPRSLGAGGFIVRRNGSGGAVPVTVTHGSGGIRLRISDITFSSPTYRVAVKPSRPGTVRVLRSRRLSGMTASVALAPTTTGGRPVLEYVVSCRASGQRARVGRSARPTIVVRGLAPGVGYSCRAHARNAVGAGAVRAFRIAATPVVRR